MYHLVGGYIMKETNQSLSELWALLRNKEQKFGLSKLSLTERNILQNIIYIQGKNNQTSLENLLNSCPHPRATFFRCLKKLRNNSIVFITKDDNDSRKSYIKVSQKFIK
tara:strand:- start:116 stop:442 length:327 start_codon:yes stop_codon:yes gene_type:complete